MAMNAPNNVCFERSPGQTESRLFFRDHLSPELVASSSVLSVIAEGGGGAQLPDSITASDFRAWASAVDFETSNGTSGPPPISKICVVLKVCHVSIELLVHA